jgi:hypothetical protein
VKGSEPPQALIKSIVSITLLYRFLQCVDKSSFDIYRRRVVAGLMFYQEEEIMFVSGKKILYGMALVLAVLAFAGCPNPTSEDGDPTLGGVVGFSSGGGAAPQAGVALAVDTSGLEGSGELTYLWERGDSAAGEFAVITGANGASYTPGANDLGKYIRVTVSRAGYKGTKTAVTAGTVAAAATTWTAEANGVSGSETSTAIIFTFSKAVTELAASDITVTGSVTVGALSGEGTTRTLALSAVAAAGNVSITINKTGIESGAKDVAVYKEGQTSDLSWTAEANGAAGTETSTSIAFTFSGAVAELDADDIVITGDTGAVAKGALAGSGTTRTLGITVTTAGNVKVKITKDGIATTEKDVAVYKAAASSNDITYSAAADGNATTSSTGITFTFSAAVADLTAEQITLANDTGDAAKGTLSGSGTSWTLGITVNTAGDVKVGISKAGIEAGEKIVAVQKFVPIVYTATADGEADTTDSTAIAFVFGAAVEGLTAEQISVTDDTGAVTTGAISGSGTNYSLGITVATAGNVKVTITKAGIEAGEKTVAVYKTPAPTLTPEVQFGTTSASDDIVITPPDGEAGDAEVNMGVSAVEKNTVYFTAWKTANQTITPSGTDAGKVTVHTSGTVDGEAASGAKAVIEVDTRGLVFDGGARSFDLEAADTEGGLPRTIHVTLNVATRKTGAAAFKVTRPQGQTYNGSEDEAILERLDTGGASFATFQAAMEWVELYAEDNTEYLIRVEQDNTSLPKFIVTFNNKENVTLRLRGDQNGPWTLKRGDTASASWNPYSAAFAPPVYDSTPGYFYGFFSIGVNTIDSFSQKTFIVGSNITIAGLGTSSYSNNANTWNAFYVERNATLALEKGSRITDWYTTETGGIWAPILVIGAMANKDPTRHGKLRIEGGSITNCTYSTGNAFTLAVNLIHFTGGATHLSAGSFYKAASTPDNPIVFSGNTDNKVMLYRTSSDNTTFDLVDGEMSLPAE